DDQKGAHGCSPAFSLQGRQTNQDDDLKSILRHLKRALARFFCVRYAMVLRSTKTSSESLS
ncbi:hypothetical protein MLX02_23650, partial [Escherichia coli]|nr:hypothetical protein [Escherichia coli]